MKHLFLFALCCTAMFAAAQKKTLKAVKPLTVGDTVPDFTFKQVLNYPSSTAKLSDFKGKLVIIDMWSTYCTACIDAFPKMQAIQDKFANQVQVILANPYPATDDPDERINKVLARAKQRTGITLTMPMPLHDTILNHLFPHQTVPHVIIIDKEGVVIAVTNSWSVTPNNIQAVLAGENLRFPVKNDWVYDKNIPLFVNGNGGDGSDFLYRSIITPYKEGFGSFVGRQVEEDGRASRFYIINYPLFFLYLFAYPGVLKYPANRTLIETANAAAFQVHHNELEDNKNSYCYEVVSPPVSGITMIKYLQEDLYRNFHAVARNEERTIACYILKSNDRVSRICSNNDSAATDIEKTTLKKFMHNQSVTALTELLNNFLDKPLIDETGLTNNISIDFPFDMYEYTPQQWKDFLSKNGFELTEEDHKLEVAVITNK
ncbi:MAG TPA: redoxin domain-containing protein [Parafilimonas sp.]|nr:redoxin domain-containing protein [Parafilimonas sp.]